MEENGFGSAEDRGTKFPPGLGSACCRRSWLKAADFCSGGRLLSGHSLLRKHTLGFNTNKLRGFTYMLHGNLARGHAMCLRPHNGDGREYEQTGMLHLPAMELKTGTHEDLHF
ncbi:unnamed protein product [Natator depressus]